MNFNEKKPTKIINAQFLFVRWIRYIKHCPLALNHTIILRKDIDISFQLLIILLHMRTYYQQLK